MAVGGEDGLPCDARLIALAHWQPGSPTRRQRERGTKLYSLAGATPSWCEAQRNLDDEGDDTLDSHGGQLVLGDKVLQHTFPKEKIDAAGRSRKPLPHKQPNRELTPATRRLLDTPKCLGWTQLQLQLVAHGQGLPPQVLHTVLSGAFGRVHVVGDLERMRPPRALHQNPLVGDVAARIVAGGIRCTRFIVLHGEARLAIGKGNGES